LAAVVSPQIPPTIIAKAMPRKPTFKSSFTQLIITTMSRATIDIIAANEISM